MSIYQFKPTFLYIKQHSVTGKLYFGKTVRDPEKYKGSGIKWKSHIAQHGTEYVVNLWYCLFLDQESCTEFALNFSKQQNIVESNLWLNSTLENGVHGGKGHKHTLEARIKISKAKRGKPSWNKGKNTGQQVWNKGKKTGSRPQAVIEQIRATTANQRWFTDGKLNTKCIPENKPDGWKSGRSC